MKIKFIVGFIILSAVIIINSCENRQAVAPTKAIAISSGCDTTKLTYSSDSNTMQAIINVQCGVGNGSCHTPGGASGYDFSKYAVIYSTYQNGALYSVLFSATPDGGSRMPLITQAGWDPNCMLPKFKAWMDRGCPQ